MLGEGTADNEVPFHCSINVFDWFGEVLLAKPTVMQKVADTHDTA